MLALIKQIALLIFAASIALPWASHAAMPLIFDTELIRLEIQGDTLRIEGDYRFLCDSTRSHISLFYPYPVDSLLGRAWTESLIWRPSPDSVWRVASFREHNKNKGASWQIKIGNSDRPEVRTVYKQLMLERYARYIVTTTSAWGRPLSHARFEVTLPPGAAISESSYPFERDVQDVWVFEAESFQPVVDIIVEWEFPRN